MDEIDLTPRMDETEENVSWARDILSRLLASDSGVCEVQRPPGRGLVYWAIRDPAQKEGFDMWPRPFDTPLSFFAQGYARASVRPPSLPPGLPFLADCPLVYNAQLDGTVTLHWLHVANGLAALRDVVAQCEASGWKRRDEGDIALKEGVPTRVEMERDGPTRRTRVAVLHAYGPPIAGFRLDLIRPDHTAQKWLAPTPPG